MPGTLGPDGPFPMTPQLLPKIDTGYVRDISFEFDEITTLLLINLGLNGQACFLEPIRIAYFERLKRLQVQGQSLRKKGFLQINRKNIFIQADRIADFICLLYTSPSPRD